MGLSIYAALVPVIVKQFNALAVILDKAEAYAKESDIEAAELLDAKLAADMFALPRQIQIATDMAKGGAGRLAGVEVPPYADDEKTFSELKARLAKTIAYIEGIPAEKFDGAEDREINLKIGENNLTFTGQAYLLNFVLPNVYFHVTTAYALLRMKGVPIGKRDFLGGL